MRTAAAGASRAFRPSTRTYARAEISSDRCASCSTISTARPAALIAAIWSKISPARRGDKAAEGRFKELQNAYDVLSDAEKRKKYDQFGVNWEQAEANYQAAK